MLRHSVLWIMRDPTSPEARLAMLQRLAYLGTEPPMVRSGDYGADLFGGSSILHEVRPSKRTPTWRRGSDGPACNFDMALHLDFSNWDGFVAYGDDPTHAEASRSNELAAWDELTARVDWYYDGESPATTSGLVKHVAMFLWTDGASDADKEEVLEAVEALAEVDGVRQVLIGRNIGKLATAYDWILDVELEDEAAAKGLLGGTEYQRAMEAVAKATHYEWTARMSHLMHRP